MSFRNFKAIVERMLQLWTIKELSAERKNYDQVIPHQYL